MKIKKWQVKHHWLEVAHSTLSDLMGILEYSRATLPKLREAKKWLNETPCLGTDLETQEFLYMASKASKREDFTAMMQLAVDSQVAYIKGID